MLELLTQPELNIIAEFEQVCGMKIRMNKVELTATDSGWNYKALWAILKQLKRQYLTLDSNHFLKTINNTWLRYN